MIFDACVVSKILYGLESLFLLQADRTKLDGFYAKCLRKISGIQHSMISRVSNKEVLQSFPTTPLSEQLLARQVRLYGKLVAESPSSLIRQVSLGPHGCRPKTWSSKRRVGRPRLQWTHCVYAVALAVAGGSEERMMALISSPQQNEWKRAVRGCRFC